ncbi:DUF2283 domain-containing protein [Rhodococcus pyridinivorans]
MRIQSARLEVDTLAEAAYFLVNDSGVKVAKTVEFNDEILVDLDDYGMVVGVEVLTLQTDVPVAQLAQKHHFVPGAEEALAFLVPHLRTAHQKTSVSSFANAVTHTRDDFLPA